MDPIIFGQMVALHIADLHADATRRRPPRIDVIIASPSAAVRAHRRTPPRTDAMEPAVPIRPGDSDEPLVRTDTVHEHLTVQATRTQ
jgi:hypothetical protein